MNKIQFLFLLGCVLCNVGFSYHSGFFWFVGLCFIFATLSAIDDN
nr:MAG TPA: hypothetical protein [Caudoviricetes sp.]